MPDSPYTTAINILLVEDQRIVGASLRHAIEGLQIPHHLTICPGSAETLTHLRRDDSIAMGAHLDVIVLDVAVSESERHALLTALQRDVVLRHLPVIVVTDSPNPNDIAWGYHLPAQNVTSQTLTRLLRPAQAIAEFWSRLVTLFAGDEEGTSARHSEGGETQSDVLPLDWSAKKR